jgi:hypothetical protein
MDQPQEDWNPDTACQEMAALFAQADAIFQQAHHQEASTKSLSRSGADPSQATVNESKGMNQSCHSSPN